MRKAVFLDRDGTLMVDAGYCARPEDVRLLPGVQTGLARLRSAGLTLVIVTNQSGLGRGYFDEAAFWRVQDAFEAQLGSKFIDAVYFCPDHPARPSSRRKPGPGMLLEAARDLGLSLGESYLLGDKESDVEAGLAAGVKLCGLVFSPREKYDGNDRVFVADNFTKAVDRIVRDLDLL
ncbi:MAG: HAD family hydrolase [Verrucomicrobia bacterium]|nr:HAD family hydrolase [Verrucomicrobiota bacterium]